MVYGVYIEEDEERYEYQIRGRMRTLFVRTTVCSLSLPCRKRPGHHDTMPREIFTKVMSNGPFISGHYLNVDGVKEKKRRKVSMDKVPRRPVEHLRRYKCGKSVCDL